MPDVSNYLFINENLYFSVNLWRGIASALGQRKEYLVQDVIDHRKASQNYRFAKELFPRKDIFQTHGRKYRKG